MRSAKITTTAQPCPGSASPTSSSTPETSSMSVAGLHFWSLAGLLVLVSAATFWPVLDNNFVDMDDEDGFVKNGHLVEPLEAMARWAWTSHLQGVYQPLSRTMYGLEASLWGVQPFGFHAVSLGLHSVYAVALLTLTVTLIRLARPSLASDRPGLVLCLAAISVGLFVAHPLRSEVIAWASVQAYEPSALLGMLSVLTYLRSRGATRTCSLAWLALSVFLFALSLAFYAITLCLPLALLVMDVYPLGRVTPGRWSRREAALVVLEKTPYFALSLVFAILTYQARQEMGTVASITSNSLASKLAVSCYGACFYLAKTVIPAGLGPIHPMPDVVSPGDPAFALSALAVLAISFAAFRLRRKWPALGAVWASYLLLQLPTSGLVRFSSTITADRYSYITMIGFPALMAGSLCLLVGRRPRPVLLVAIGSAALVVAVAFIGLSRAECAAWRDSVSIWSHVADSHGRPEGFFESRIGRALAQSGKLDEAQLHLEEAVRLSPGLAYAHGKLGLVLVEKGRVSEAHGHFAEAVRLEPSDVESRLNLAYTLVQLRHPDQAVSQLTEAVRLKPRLPEAQANLGAVLVQLGRFTEAESHLAEALRLAPDRPTGRMDLAYALAQQRKFAEAAELYSEQVRLRPDDPNARHNLAAVLDHLGRRDEARIHAVEARRIEADVTLGKVR